MVYYILANTFSISVKMNGKCVYVHTYFLLSIILLYYYQVSSTNINLYSSVRLKGNKFDIEVDDKGHQCENLKEVWQNRVSSIDTKGLCLDLYAEGNCTGTRKIRLYPGNDEYHKDLRVWDFNDELMSLQACDKVINNNNYEREGDTVKLWDAEGGKLYINVPSCKNLPTSWSNRTTSAKTHNRCYKFFSELNCKGIQLRLDKYNEQYNFGKWNFSNLTNSIKPCPNQNTITDYGNVTFEQNEIVDDSPDTEYEVIDNKIIHAGSVNEIVISISVFLIIGGMVIGLFMYYRSRNNSSSTEEISPRYLSKTYLDNFMHGNPSVFETVNNENNDAICIAEYMPYDTATYEVPLKSLEIEWQTPLGSGQYGRVLKAKVTHSKFPESFYVAVKTVKADADPDYVKALLGELKIMIYLNESNTDYYNQKDQRKHIVNLIGACTQNISQLEPYILLELCINGSLLNYLRDQRGTFVKRVGQDQVQKHTNSNYKTTINGSSPITTVDLLRWSIAIASGMDFLSSKKVIHGDLAARNILLDDQLNAKITDFGLSRQLYHYTQYVKSQQAPLPWRWMAIESLQDMNFSTKSDVWSFAITLHEIFTLGEIPYPGIMFNPEFLTSLKDGYRMSAPGYAPLEVYNLMEKCWKEKSGERPSFCILREHLFNILDAKVYTTLS